MTRITIAGCCLLLVIACSQTDPPPKGTGQEQLDQVAWLAGTWEMQEDGKTIAEQWERGADALTGHGLSITGTDTTLTEKLEIRATDSGLFYIADVPQNPAPVWFRMTEGSDSLVMFENPDYQLPNKITYIREAPDLIRVKVDGMRGDQPTGFQLLLARPVAGSGSN